MCRTSPFRRKGGKASMNEGPDPYPAADIGGVHSAPPRTRACLLYRTNRDRSSSVTRKSPSDAVSFRRRSPRGLQGGIASGVLRYAGWRRTPYNGLTLQRARCRSPIPEVDDSSARRPRSRACPIGVGRTRTRFCTGFGRIVEASRRAEHGRGARTTGKRRHSAESSRKRGGWQQVRAYASTGLATFVKNESR